MASLVDACIFIAASAGTGDFVVSAPKPGWRTPATAGAVNGDTYRYRAYSADQTQWEVGTGVYTSGTTTLTRAVITDSSNAGAAVNFSAAPSVALTIFSGDLATPAQLAKVDYLTVTASTNLDTIRTTIAGLGTASTKATGTSAGQVPLLDGSGLLDTSILPAIAVTDVNVVASQAAMLALTAQKGDVAIRSDINKSFALATNSPGTLADWKELLTPTDVVLSVASLTGAISAAGLKTALAIAVADVTDASANGRSLVSAVNYAAMKTLLAVAQADVTGLTTASSPQFTGIELGHSTDTTLGRSAAGVMTVEGVVVPTVSSTSTLTNKRVTPRVTTITSNAAPTVNTDTTDIVNITALASAITSMTTNLTGTPSIGDVLIYQIKDNGVARAITWGASFAAKGVALPTTTVISKLLTVSFMWNGSNWGCVGVASEA